jgi:hypothetical protein
VSIEPQQGDVLIENVRYLLDQGVHRDRIVAATGRTSIAALERALYRINAHDLARRIHADPTPEAINSQALAPVTKDEVRRR